MEKYLEKFWKTTSGQIIEGISDGILGEIPEYILKEFLMQFSGEPSLCLKGLFF